MKPQAPPENPSIVRASKPSWFRRADRFSKVVWYIGATALILGGFALDSVTAIGHHAGLILGGVAFGLTFRK